MLTISYTKRSQNTAPATLLLAGLLSLLAACSSTKSTLPNDGIVANGKALKGKKAYRMDYKVGIAINASPETIWAVLTNAADYPNWNSTIDSIEGTIALDEKIKLHAKISPKRAFKLKVSEFSPSTKMVWSDGNAMFKGVRTYTLEAMGNDTTVFTMHEVFTGAMLPMIKSSLPDFTNDFEAFAADLKRKAEAKQ